MKFLLILLFPLSLHAYDNPFDKNWYDLSNRGCLVGWFQLMMETSDTRKEQKELGKVFCDAYAKAVVKKLNE